MAILRSSRLLPIAIAMAVGLSSAPARAEGTNSRWIAALPFGIGQFQNDNFPLGIAFAAAEAGLAGASIATALVTGKLASTRVTAGSFVDVTALNDSLRATVRANQVTFAAWAALTTGGVIEAQVSFVPRRAACREQPCPSFMATAAPVPGGGLLGIRGAF